LGFNFAKRDQIEISVNEMGKKENLVSSAIVVTRKWSGRWSPAGTGFFFPLPVQTVSETHQNILTIIYNFQATHTRCVQY